MRPKAAPVSELLEQLVGWGFWRWKGARADVAFNSINSQMPQSSALLAVNRPENEEKSNLSPQEKERLLDLFLYKLRIVIDQLGGRIQVRVG